MKITCKEYYNNIKESVKKTIQSQNNGKKYILNIFQIGDNPASESYTKGRIKDCEEVGIEVKLHKYPYDETGHYKYNDVLYCTGKIMLQMPVPDNFDIYDFSRRILPYKDVDGLTKDYSYYDPCTAAGIIDWLDINEIDLTGKNICIIGRSDIVGKPLAKMMNSRNATVTLCHSKTSNLEEHMKIADIIVVAIGKAKFIHDIDLPKRPLVIDVGINFDNGKLCGDVDYENMKNTCSYITPVPGGVGLLTRATLLKHIIKF